MYKYFEGKEFRLYVPKKITEINKKKLSIVNDTKFPNKILQYLTKIHRNKIQYNSSIIKFLELTLSDKILLITMTQWIIITNDAFEANISWQVYNISLIPIKLLLQFLHIRFNIKIPLRNTHTYAPNKNVCFHTHNKHTPILQ